MSAGMSPEGFSEYMGDVHEAAVRVLQCLGEHDPRVEIPAMLMATVFLVRGYVEEGRFESMEVGMSIVFGGLEALKNDHLREMAN